MTDPGPNQKETTVHIPKSLHNFFPKQINIKYNHLKFLQHLIHALIFFILTMFIPVGCQAQGRLAQFSQG